MGPILVVVVVVVVVGLVVVPGLLYTHPQAVSELVHLLNSEQMTLANTHTAVSE